MYKKLVSEVKKRLSSPYYDEGELDEVRKGAEATQEYEDSEFREKNYKKKKKVDETEKSLDILRSRKQVLQSLGG